MILQGDLAMTISTRSNRPSRRQCWRAFLWTTRGRGSRCFLMPRLRQRTWCRSCCTSIPTSASQQVLIQGMRTLNKFAWHVETPFVHVVCAAMSVSTGVYILGRAWFVIIHCAAAPEEALAHPYVEQFHNIDDEPSHPSTITIPIDDNHKVLSIEANPDH